MLHDGEDQHDNRAEDEECLYDSKGGVQKQPDERCRFGGQKGYEDANQDHQDGDPDPAALQNQYHGWIKVRADEILLTAIGCSHLPRFAELGQQFNNIVLAGCALIAVV